MRLALPIIIRIFLLPVSLLKCLRGRVGVWRKRLARSREANNALQKESCDSINLTTMFFKRRI
jgi:hypothetical protein